MSEPLDKNQEEMFPPPEDGVSPGGLDPSGLESAGAGPAGGGADDPDAEVPILVTPGDLGDLQKKAEEREVFLNELRRARADLDNYHKRVRKDRALWEEHAETALLRKLLPVVDDLDRALRAIDDGAPSSDTVAEGVRMTHQAFLKVLEDEGVEEIPALGEQFDPSMHEAVMEEPVGDRPTGEVLEVLSKGYRRRDAVLRPTRVKVARNVVSG